MPRKQSEKGRRPLELFPASTPPKFVAMDILRPLRRVPNGNQFVLLLTDRYLKVEGAVSTSKTTGEHNASIYMDHCIILFGVPDYVLADSGTQFLNKLFESLYSFCKRKTPRKRRITNRQMGMPKASTKQLSHDNGNM